MKAWQIYGRCCSDADDNNDGGGDSGKPAVVKWSSQLLGSWAGLRFLGRRERNYYASLKEREKKEI